MTTATIESFGHYWNPLLMRVFRRFAQQSNTYLFGMTGDIDNLGIYVAKNGRARAENMVDLYNQIIRNEVIQWQRKHSTAIVDLAFVASGEEIMLLGVSNDRPPVTSLFQEFPSRMNRIIRDNRYLDIGETGISFGCSFLDDIQLKQKIVQMTMDMDAVNGVDEFEQYLAITETIRESLAVELDRAKFSTLGPVAQNNAVLLRNVVYAHMLDYKYGTSRSLRAICQDLPNLMANQYLFPLREHYGLDDSRRRIALDLKRVYEVDGSKEPRP